MSDSVLLFVVLCFALYGILCLIHRVSLLILEPDRRLHTFSLAYLRHGDENAEQIIRYFRARAGREDVLLLVDSGVDAGEKQVIRKMCENRRDVRLISEENFAGENCNWSEYGL